MSPCPRRRCETGLGTMLALGMVTVLVSATVLALAVVRVVAARHVAASSADLGALAGAQAAVQGQDACAAVAEVVRANNAELVECRRDGLDVVVRTVVRTQPLLGLRWAPESAARAGPAA